MSGDTINNLTQLTLPLGQDDVRMIGRGAQTFQSPVTNPVYPIPILFGVTSADSAPRGLISDDPTVWWETVDMPVYLNGSQSNWSDAVYVPEWKLLFACAALNNGGNKNVIAASRDGRKWAGRGDDLTAVHNGIAWAPSISTLCIVGAAGTTTSNRVRTSTDGIVWTERALPTINITLNCVAWSPTLSRFVAMGSSNVVFTSPDGITWTQRTAPVSGGSWRRVLWAGGTHNKFYALDGNNVANSSDGITWSALTNVFSGNLRGFAFSPSLNTLVTTDANSNNFISHSTNGTTWNNHTVTGFWEDCCWSPRLNKFIAAGSGRLGTSTDGATWTNAAQSAIARNLSWSRLIATQ
jgi:hypothetical protein